MLESLRERDGRASSEPCKQLAWQRCEQNVVQRDAAEPRAKAPEGDADLIADVAQLYLGGRTWSAMAVALDVPVSTVHSVLHELFKEGFPKLKLHKLSDMNARAAYRAYMRHETTPTGVAQAHGVHRTTVERRWRKLGLDNKRPKKSRGPVASEADKRVSAVVREDRECAAV
ncbi:MAG TPA: hypothetical protein VMB05_12475 [Solirubrobacteraceae bacterium]|nr:hypothetical protein [Solirubrobacteraceae bacterium]